MVIFLSPIRDLVDDDREIAGRGHDEQAAPMAARFPHRADGPLFFGVGGCVAILAFAFHDKETAILELAGAIGVKPGGRGLPPEGSRL